MTPTTKLRFVTRESPFKKDGTEGWIKIKVLQQWWEPSINVGWADIPTGNGEWRDVPLEEE